MRKRAHGYIGWTDTCSADPRRAVRAFFTAYSEASPGLFDEIVSPEYLDYGHSRPGRELQGARNDYQNAVELASGVLKYEIDALVTSWDAVAVAWTGHLPNDSN
jgi:hypothetical protein